MVVELNREINPLDPPEWGPTVWKYLHLLTERLGRMNNPIIDLDQATFMELLITQLPNILPCTECQKHAIDYFSLYPLPPLKGLHGHELRNTVREWLFQFHTAVRVRLGQPITVQSAEHCIPLYTDQFLQKCEYTAFTQSVAAAVRQGWVRMDHWRKWYSTSERMRMLSGNVVI